jgi:hypothetical protein
MCGLWGREDHWSGAARLPGGLQAEPPLMRSRQAQAALLSRFTRPHALVRDWGASAWVVEGRTGGSEVVSTLGDVWQAVERLTGKPVDPLDLAWIQSFEGAARR